MTALSIRKDRTPAVLRKLAKAEADTRVARRLLAIANALSGMSRKEAAEAAGMDCQTLRDWVIRYNRAWSGRALRLLGRRAAAKACHAGAGRADPPRSGRPRSGKRPFGLYARGSGAPLQSPLRQELPSRLHGAALKAPRFLAAEGKAQPPAQRPGRSGGL